ncbi:MAG: PilZ domain-containing protein [Deltaproteobacteria bacterium]|nr:PilZ domain-containing protein [Deltaproteobacteria bacterium]
MTYSGAQQAKAAREILSNALSALQATANIPPDVLAVTTHVAGSLGALFDAERSSSEIDGKACARRALEGLGQTLALLQDVRSQHEAIGKTTELIAKAMTVVFPLTQKPSLRPPPPPGAPPRPAPSASTSGQRPPAAATMLNAPPQRPSQEPAAPVDVPPPPAFLFGGAAPMQGAQPAAAPPHPPQAAPSPPRPPPPQAAPHYAPPVPQAAPYPQPVPAAFASPAPQPAAAPSHASVPFGGAVAPQATPYAAQPVLRPASTSGSAGYGPQVGGGSPQAQPQQRPSITGASIVEANIGATTESNFYVGFSGEISEGGIFLATYDVRPVGQLVEVHLTLPGGFEERVQGNVRWVREPHDVGSDTTPGMGIGFVSLTAQQRELILRFVRKRAPMFYDE